MKGGRCLSSVSLGTIVDGTHVARARAGVSADVWMVRGALTQRLRPAAPGDRTEGGSVPTAAWGLL